MARRGYISRSCGGNADKPVEISKNIHCQPHLRETVERWKIRQDVSPCTIGASVPDFQDVAERAGTACPEGDYAGTKADERH